MARTQFLSFSPPLIGEDELNSVASVLRASEWLSSGPKTKEFEENFCKVVGAHAALALNSCTAGLHLGLIAHGVKPGDEVITTPMTFCATANVIEHCGGTTVLADVEPDTLLIDVHEIEKKASKKTKVIVPVHYAGHPADMEKINSLARGHGAAVIEDAAHCMPSKIGGRWVGSGDNLCAFSFYATKNMTTGEGGMLTGPKELLDKARMMALHGMSKGAWDRFKKGGNWRYDVPAPGFKYNLTDIASALGLVQLARIEELYRLRLKLVEFYDKAFKGSANLQTLRVKPGYQSSYHLYPILLNLEKLRIDRDEFIVQLTERNIGSGVHYQPVHMHSYYAKKYGWKPESFPNAAAAFERMLSIPLSSAHTVADAADVVQAVEDIFVKFKR